MDTLSIVRDPAWQFVGIFLAVIAIGASFLVYQWQKQRRELASGVYYESSLLDVTQDIADRVQVSFDGKPVSNLRLVVLAMKNSGNQPFLPTDFLTPIRVQFPEATIPLSLDVSLKVPPNLDLQVKLIGNTIEVSPTLLNPGDQFLLKVLAMGKPCEPNFDVRVVGTSKLVPINRLSDHAGRKKVRRNLVQLPIAACFFGAVSFFVQEFANPGTYFALALFIVVPLMQWLHEYFTNTANRYVDE